MNESIFVALLSLAGTLIGSIAGILTANKLTTYRIDQLEKKVEKHNKVVERTYKLEKDEAVFYEKLEEIERDIKELKALHGR